MLVTFRIAQIVGQMGFRIPPIIRVDDFAYPRSLISYKNDSVSVYCSYFGTEGLIMTEFELVESIGIFLSNALSSISVYLTLVSAYLVAAFIAGSRLSRSQVIIVNTLFVTGALIFTYSTVGMLLRQSYFAAKLAEIETDTWLAGTAPVAPVMGALLLGGICACLKFMWDVRRLKRE